MFVKLLHRDFIHGQVRYELGLNIDPVPFSPSGQCQPGGLYYSSPSDIWHFYKPDHAWIAVVKVPPNAKTYRDPGPFLKWKSDRIVLTDIVPLSSWLDRLPEQEQHRIVEIDKRILLRITNPSYTLQLRAIGRLWNTYGRLDSEQSHCSKTNPGSDDFYVTTFAG